MYRYAPTRFNHEQWVWFSWERLPVCWIISWTSLYLLTYTIFTSYNIFRSLKSSRQYTLSLNIKLQLILQQIWYLMSYKSIANLLNLHIAEFKGLANTYLTLHCCQVEGLLKQNKHKKGLDIYMYVLLKKSSKVHRERLTPIL